MSYSQSSQSDWSDSNEDMPQIETAIVLRPEENNITELHIAVEENRVSEVQKLVANKTIINSRTKDNGATSLLLSCFLPADTTIATVLINSGADVNLCDFGNCSPLLAACKSETEKTDIVELLIQSGANINHQDNFQYTALHYAVENNHLQVVDLLLQSGADTSLRNYRGENPLMMAFLKKEENFAAKILPYTKDLNAVDSSGWSALLFALHTGTISKDLIIRLVEQGANVNNINEECDMPAAISAIKFEDPTTFEYLWNLTDIDVLKGENGFHTLIKEMLVSDWITPTKIQYFYKVLDTPGHELISDFNYLEYLFYYMDHLDSDDKYLSIDVCGIVTKLMEKNVKLSDFEIIKLIYLCSRHKFAFKHKLFQILVNNNVDLNNFRFIQISVEHDPEFTVLLLPYSICYIPIDIFELIINIKTLNIPLLKLVKCILRLGTPSFKLREDCIKYFKSFDVINYNLNAEDKVILLELYNEVLELLSVDRLPTLQELSRDKIRKCLTANCVSTVEYLSKLNTMQLPKFMTNIIRCKSVVNL